MENTKTNKLKFTALYWGARVAKTEFYQDLKTVSDIIYKEYGGMTCIYCTEYLELKSIKNINYIDLLNMARHHESTATNIYIFGNQLNFTYMSGDESESVAVELNSGFCLDYLRSNGFATEWMGLSVDKLQEYGWIKLVN